MPAPRTIFLAGWHGEPPRLAGYALRPISIAEISRTIRAAREGTILLLGEDALRVLNPETFGKARLHRCHAFGVYRDAPPDEAIAWARSRVLEVVHVRRVLSRIRQVSRVLRRADVPLARWAPRVPDPGTLADRILLVLPTLPRPHVVALAEELDVERHALTRECKEAFGIPAEDLCWKYVDGYVRQERGRGVSVTEICSRLGYADSRSLWRFYRRHGMSVPPRVRPER